MNTDLPIQKYTFIYGLILFTSIVCATLTSPYHPSPFIETNSSFYVFYAVQGIIGLLFNPISLVMITACTYAWRLIFPTFFAGIIYAGVYYASHSEEWALLGWTNWEQFNAILNISFSFFAIASLVSFFVVSVYLVKEIEEADQLSQKSA